MLLIYIKAWKIHKLYLNTEMDSLETLLPTRQPVSQSKTSLLRSFVNLLMISWLHFEYFSPPEKWKRILRHYELIIVQKIYTVNFRLKVPNWKLRMCRKVCLIWNFLNWLENLRWKWSDKINLILKGGKLQELSLQRTFQLPSVTSIYILQIFKIIDI